MITVTLIDSDGIAHELEGAAGTSLMEVARQSGVPGIIAECGGNMNCASCHVYVEPEWLDRVGVAPADESDMLEGSLAEPMPNSRLSCQVSLAQELSGLVVHVPEES